MEEEASVSPSISEWLHGFKQGDEDAAQRLWDRVFHRLVQHAQARIGHRPEAAMDAEEIAASVFESLWRGAQAGRFDEVRNRDALWFLLLKLTRNKLADHVRKKLSLKRGEGRTPQSLSRPAGEDSDAELLEEIAAKGLSAEYALAFEEEYARLRGLLRGEYLHDIAAYRIEGHSNKEIAEKCGIALSTVNRKLELIRVIWAHELQR